MTQDIFIGIDGGGTKCKIRVEDHTGQLLGQAVGGPANVRLSVEIAWQSIYQTLNEILQARDISLHDKNFRFHAGIGLAGCEVLEARNNYLSMPHPFATLQLVSDAHIACLGAHGLHDGAIIIVGTGVIGYQIQQGQGTKVSGWGFPHDDEGGGAWLGLEAVRLTFQSLDHRIEKTPLLEEIFAYFNHDIPHFVAWANKANSSEYARLAPLVINHSQQNDHLAVRLMKKAAQAVNQIAVALEKTQKQVLPCCLFGGVAPFIEPWLSDELHSRLVPHQGDANAGAILMVRQLLEAQ